TINENTWMKYKIDYKAVNMQPFKLNNINAYQMRCTLSQVSQEKLIVLFVENNYAYKIEYTATNISYNDFLKDVRKVINSFVFVE
ncbi:MAG: hypothetical protein H7Y00_05175, partial [Fimbriimonadaceae bacterium]|nr:hypothetical protein [Chitinophagales bacterium]